MAKSRISKQEAADLYEARRVVMLNREAADAGNANARQVVAVARDTVARLTAKRDNRIWL